MFKNDNFRFSQVFVIYLKKGYKFDKEISFKNDSFRFSQVFVINKASFFWMFTLPLNLQMFKTNTLKLKFFNSFKSNSNPIKSSFYSTPLSISKKTAKQCKTHPKRPGIIAAANCCCNGMAAIPVESAKNHHKIVCCWKRQKMRKK